jgi:hypothetical protein
MFRKLCVALVPVLLALSGCASSKVNADDRATFNAALRKSRVVSTGADITLPFDSYFMSTPQANQFDRAAQILARDCMKRFGFDWRIRVTAVKVEVAPKAGRYGLIDADAAATYGYHATPDEADTGGDAGVKPDAATAMVYFGNGPSTYAGQTVPKGGCLGEARSKLAEGAPVSLSTQELRGLQNELYHKAQADRRVQAAMAGPEKITLSVSVDQARPGGLTLDASGANLDLVGFAASDGSAVEEAGNRRWRQIGFTEATGSRFTAGLGSSQPGTATADGDVLVAAVACLGGNGPTAVVDVKAVRMGNPATPVQRPPLGQSEIVAAARSACQYPGRN